MPVSHGFAALEQGGPLVSYAFERPSPGPHDIVLDIRYCGLCHSDLSCVDNEWGFHTYPIVPGHEIVGKVVHAGATVSKFAIGDWVGVGTVTDSCGTCDPCSRGLETYCKEGFTPSFGAPDRRGRMTHGGFSNDYVIDEAFALSIPAALDPASAAPLLCAGITTFSPLRRAGLRPGDRLGIVGLGGLGHLAVQWARAWDAHVVVLSGTPAKAADALRLGADEVLITSDRDAFTRMKGSFRYILDTVSASHDVGPLLDLLDFDGTLCLIGMPAEPSAISSMQLAAGRKTVTSSMTGGIAETQEMMDFAARHGVRAEIELLPLDAINEAFGKLRRNEARYRLVLEMPRAGILASTV